MPPQITFIDTHHGPSIPVKVIVRKNRRTQVDKGSDISVNSQSVVRLQTPLPNFQVRLSNSYLDKIINEDCQHQLHSILCDNPLDLQNSVVTAQINAGEAPTVARPLITIVVPVNLILAYRLNIGKVLLEEEQVILDRASKTNPHRNYLRVLAKRTKGAKSSATIEAESDDDSYMLREDYTGPDTKMELFKLALKPLINSLASCIKIYVLDTR